MTAAIAVIRDVHNPIEGGESLVAFVLLLYYRPFVFFCITNRLFLEIIDSRAEMSDKTLCWLVGLGIDSMALGLG